jgi:Flp pilus assembly protein TadD
VKLLRVRCSLILAGCLLATASLSFAAARSFGQADGANAADGADVAQLIEELGSENFATREKAQNELKALGVRAFDALYAAQSHEDIEIALRAQYLVRSLNIEWSQDDASAEVKRILRGYDELENVDRKSRMDRLASLEQDEGLAALVRLVRYETSPNLAKQGALLVMNRPRSDDGAVRARQAAIIREALGRSQREATIWLSAYAETLEDEAASAAKWAELADAEFQRFQETPVEPDREVVRDLLRWNAALLERLERKDEARQVVKRSLELLTEDRQQLIEAVDWLLARGEWEEIESIADKFAETFGRSTELNWRLAEAQLKRGDAELAAKTAEKAFEREADDVVNHLEAAFWLQDRGLFDWAEKEYRHVISLEVIGSPYDLYARLLLSEMLHDLERELPAAETLAPAVEAMDKDPAISRILPRFNREPGSLRSRLHYFYAKHEEQQSNREKQRDQLKQAIASDTNDADVLIAMFRLPEADDAWKNETRQSIQKAANHFRSEIKRVAAEYEQAASEKDRDDLKRELAHAHNQFAWLVSNTEGDFDEALECSLKSLELRPQTSGYLDTLGRCHFAKGDLENAIATQTRAVELEPHSLQIRRQLELFQKAASEKK